MEESELQLIVYLKSGKSLEIIRPVSEMKKITLSLSRGDSQNVYLIYEDSGDGARNFVEFPRENIDYWEQRVLED